MTDNPIESRLILRRTNASGKTVSQAIWRYEKSATQGEGDSRDSLAAIKALKESLRWLNTFSKYDSGFGATIDGQCILPFSSTKVELHTQIKKLIDNLNEEGRRQLPSTLRKLSAYTDRDTRRELLRKFSGEVSIVSIKLTNYGIPKFATKTYCVLAKSEPTVCCLGELDIEVEVHAMLVEREGRSLPLVAIGKSYTKRNGKQTICSVINENSPCPPTGADIFDPTPLRDLDEFMEKKKEDWQRENMHRFILSGWFKGKYDKNHNPIIKELAEFRMQEHKNTAKRNKELVTLVQCLTSKQ